MSAQDTKIAAIQSDVADIEQVAGEANTNADAALTTANEANTTATQAKTTADGIDGKATQALATSQTAEQTAQEAKEIAEDAAQGNGTRVSVGEAFQQTLSFASDPQTQITANKNAIAEAQTDISDIIDGSQTVGKATQDANGNVIDETYAKLSQVVTKDNSTTNINATTDAAKYFLRNKQVSTGAVAIGATGWYRIAKLPTYSSSRITVTKQYNYGRGISLILDVAVGADNTEDATTNIVASYAGMRGQSNYIDKVRYKHAGNGQVYIDDHIISDGNQNSYWLAYDGTSADTTAFTSSEFALYAFQQTSDTGGTELPMPEDTGLATTGQIYQQGAPVFATDPSKLAPSTANGWTQTTATGTLPSAGVYLVAATLEGVSSILSPCIMVFDGTHPAVTSTIAAHHSTNIGYVPELLDLEEKWFAEDMSSHQAVTMKNIYYKRIA